MIGTYKIPEKNINRAIRNENLFWYLFIVTGFINVLLVSIIIFFVILFIGPNYFFLIIPCSLPFIYHFCTKNTKEKIKKKYRDYTIIIKEEKIIHKDEKSVVNAIFWKNAIMSNNLSGHIIISNKDQNRTTNQIIEIVTDVSMAPPIKVNKQLEHFREIKKFIKSKINESS